MPTILFVIEEFAAVFKDKTVKNMLLLALSQWRSIGIYVLITTQRPSSKILEGDLKANLGIILGLKTLDSNNSNVVIDKYNLLNNLRGDGHGYIRHDGKLEEFQSFYITHTQVKKQIKHLIVKKESIPVPTKENIPKETPGNNIITIKNDEIEGYNKDTDNKNKIGEVADLSFLEDL